MASNPETEDLINEINENVNIAYYRGYEKGKEQRLASDQKLEDPKIILREFLAFVKPMKRTIVGDDVLLSDDKTAYQDESIIRNFMLQHGYF